MKVIFSKKEVIQAMKEIAEEIFPYDDTGHVVCINDHVICEDELVFEMMEGGDDKETTTSTSDNPGSVSG